MAKTYNTSGRKQLLDFLINNPDRQLTAEEITAELGKDGGSASQSSVYRRLSELCEEGSVRKFRAASQSSFVYQYVGHGDCSHHFHLKCVGCGRLLHLDCHLSDELLEHIREDHHFRVDSGRSILYGFCDSCGVSAPASAQGRKS